MQYMSSKRQVPNTCHFMIDDNWEKKEVERSTIFEIATSEIPRFSICAVYLKSTDSKVLIAVCFPVTV